MNHHSPPMLPASEIINAFTCDVEDYYQVSAFEAVVSRADWKSHESRVEANTRRVLALLSRHSVRGTFYILGWVAEQYPGLVREIHAAGHEIGSHSYWHRLIYTQTPEEFRDDLQRSRDILEDLLGISVTLYRAPSFSITKNSLWALDILAEEGFQIDSSLFPTHHDRYGIPDARPEIHRLETASGKLWEFPPSVLRIGGSNLPVGGGGYFRLYPSRWTHWCLRQINHRLQRPFMFYIHPWELDPEQPRISGLSKLSRFRHYVHLKRTESKLDALLRTFHFDCVSQVIQSQRKQDLAVVADPSCPAIVPSF